MQNYFSNLEKLKNILTKDNLKKEEKIDYLNNKKNKTEENIDF